MRTIRHIKALDAVTATTTSSKFYVGGAVRVGIQLRRSQHGSGSSAFAVKGSMQPITDGAGVPDAFNNPTGGTGVTMTALNTLIDNVTNSNAQNITRVNGKTLSADGDAFLWLDPACLMNWLEITVTETTDGTHSATIVVEEEKA